jgi:hypothetical protein
MAERYETAIERQLREAQERGEFDNLKGAGKPLPGYGGNYDEDWWVKDWVRREGAGATVLPPTLALRREREEIEREADRRHTEDQVRQYVAALNEQIRRARVGLLDGPPTLLPPLDPEVIVRGWRRRRGRA